MELLWQQWNVEDTMPSAVVLMMELQCNVQVMSLPAKIRDDIWLALEFAEEEVIEEIMDMIGALKAVLHVDEVIATPLYRLDKVYRLQKLYCPC